MSRFGEALRIIPRTAWIIGIASYLVASTLLLFVFIPTDREMSHWPLVARAASAYGMCLIVLIWVLLIGYVYADAKRRGMPYVMWTGLAMLVPNAIGIILYFALRDPLPKLCPHCATPARPGFVFCPACGTAMQPACPNCGRGIESGWSNCPHCGTKLPSPTPRAL
jgi:hypothetical protein